MYLTKYTNLVDPVEINNRNIIPLLKRLEDLSNEISHYPCLYRGVNLSILGNSQVFSGIL